MSGITWGSFVRSVNEIDQQVEKQEQVEQNQQTGKVITSRSGLSRGEKFFFGHFVFATFFVFHLILYLNME